MGNYKFIKIKGKGTEGKLAGYFVPRLYQLVWSKTVLKAFGLPYVMARLTGWTIWWTNNEDDFALAIKKLDELKKTRIFTYEVCEHL